MPDRVSIEEQLRFEEGRYGSAWPETLLKYKELKTLLNKHAHGGQGDDTRKAFFSLLENEIQRINKTYLKLANGAHRHYQRHGVPGDQRAGTNGILNSLTRVIESVAGCSRVATPHRCLSRVANAYARANADAIREILEMYDTECHGTRGSDFWTSLWRDHDGNMSFLHSPVRVRMDAIETLTAELCSHHSGHDADNDSPFCATCGLRKADLLCPICLDALYRPIALSCGHAYCFPCLMSACDLGQAVGTFRALISNIDPSIPCPKCRQKDVYRHAALVPELESLVRHQYPAEWAERDKEEKANTAKKYEKVNKERNQTVSIFGARPTDLLY